MQIVKFDKYKKNTPRSLSGFSIYNLIRFWQLILFNNNMIKNLM
jgi:hypothetical protein